MKQLVAVAQDHKLLKRAFGCFPSGIVVIAAWDGDGPVGLVMSSFSPVSLVPPLVSVCVQETSQTWPRLRTCRRLGVSILAEGHDDACVRLSRKVGDRFEGIPWEKTAEGSIFIDHAAAWLNSSVYGELPAGDHQIALLEVLHVMTEPSKAPLIFHGSRFRSLAVDNATAL